jgi:hypothetical protein
MASSLLPSEESSSMSASLSRRPPTRSFAPGPAPGWPLQPERPVLASRSQTWFRLLYKKITNKQTQMFYNSINLVRVIVN